MSDEIKGEQTPVADEVVQAVTAEIKTLGENTKKNYEELQANYKKLKEVVERENDDQYDKNYIDNLAKDITTRQEALDKESEAVKEKMQKQIDQLELFAKRPGAGKSDSDVEKSEKEYKKFVASCLSAREKGSSYEELEKSAMTRELFKQYKDSYTKYLRKGTDHISLMDNERKALSEGVDPHGGYTTTPVMSNRIITKLYESDPMRQLCYIESISGPELDLFVDADEADCGWESETESGAETGTPDFGMKKIQVHTMYAKPKATRALLEDSGISIETWLANKIAERMGRVEGAAFLTGDGIGKPRGLLTYDSGTTHKTVEQVSMGHASQLTADGFIDIKYSLIEQYLNSGNWLMNRLTVKDAMKLKYGTGEYIWKPGITQDAQSTILGLSVRMSTTMPQVAANALAVILADFSSAYAIVDRLGITIERDPYTKKPFIEFYTRKRVGGGLIDGQSCKIGKIST